MSYLTSILSNAFSVGMTGGVPIAVLLGAVEVGIWLALPLHWHVAFVVTVMCVFGGAVYGYVVNWRRNRTEEAMDQLKEDGSINKKWIDLGE